MENSQEKKTEELEQVEQTPNDNEEIEFDDNIDLDLIQKQLRQQATADNVEAIQAPETPESEEISQPNAQIDSQIIIDSEKINDADCKKYIVYVNPENVDFIDHLSVTERKKLINDILRNQDTKAANEKHAAQRKHFIEHLIIAVMTLILGVPILYFVINKSVELTIQSYKQSQKNFEQLYRESGKIQQKKITTETF